ncbi:MAG: hypothetical protein ACRDOL_44220, partial [Streptosporangiaceae bacterium]
TLMASVITASASLQQEASKARSIADAVAGRCEPQSLHVLTRYLTNITYTSDYDDRRDARTAIRGQGAPV